MHWFGARPIVVPAAAAAAAAAAAVPAAAVAVICHDRGGPGGDPGPTPVWWPVYVSSS